MGRPKKAPREYDVIYFNFNSVLTDFAGTIEEMLDEGAFSFRPLPQSKISEEDDERVWKIISKDVDKFYDNLQINKEIVFDFLELHKTLGGEKVQIVTKLPSEKRGISPDKVKENVRKWVEQKLKSSSYNNPEFIIHFRTNEEELKKLCKGPQCLLIDDDEKIADKWDEWGGTAFRFNKWSGLETYLSEQNIYYSEDRQTLVKLGENLKKARIRINMTQSGLAGEMNVTPATVSNWEAGKGMSIENLLEVAIILNVSTDYLLGQIDDYEMHGSNIDNKSREIAKQLRKIADELEA